MEAARGRWRQGVTSQRGPPSLPEAFLFQDGGGGGGLLAVRSEEAKEPRGENTRRERTVPKESCPAHSQPKPWPPWWPNAKAPNSSAKQPSGGTPPSWIIAGRPSRRSREPPPASSASTASTASSSTSWLLSYCRCFWC